MTRRLVAAAIAVLLLLASLDVAGRVMVQAGVSGALLSARLEDAWAAAASLAYLGARVLLLWLGPGALVLLLAWALGGRPRPPSVVRSGPPGRRA